MVTISKQAVNDSGVGADHDGKEETAAEASVETDVGKVVIEGTLKQPPEELNNSEDVTIGIKSVAVAAQPTVYNFGISEEALLAPIPVPAKKKRKTQDEFTISQKLDILNELKGPNPPTIPALAAKHNTSRTSVYRWKNDEERLLNLMKQEGKGNSKRVSSSSHVTKSTTKRKSNNEEYTAAEKLAVVRQLKGDNPPSVKSLADKVGANHRSIYRWKKDEAKLIRLVEQEGKGLTKRASGDPLLRIKEALKLFHTNVYANVNPGEKPAVSITGTSIATKARQIRDEMLAQHAISPFLSDEEVESMKKFNASTSWGRKLIHKFEWKGSSADESVAAAMLVETKGGKGTTQPIVVPKLPPMETIKKPAADTNVSKSSSPTMADLKREITLLKKKLNAAENKVKKLTEENIKLKSSVSLPPAIGINQMMMNEEAAASRDVGETTVHV